MRLIDADIADVVTIYDKSNELTQVSAIREYIERQKAFLDKFPTIDAVPVVRCGECEHHYWEQEPCHGKSVHYCKLPHMRGVEVFKEFFCYYGERKEGDGNE